MNGRTSRRRISPRAVRRCRAIKNFVRRALGSSSQRDIRSNSSISVLDLRHNVDGIEQEFDTVSKHCQDLETFESTLKLNDTLDSEKDSDIDTKNIVAKTETLQNISQDRYDKPVHSRSSLKIPVRDNETGINISASNKMPGQNYSNNYKESRKSKHELLEDTIEANKQRLNRRKKYNNMVSRTTPANLPMHGSHSFNEPKNHTRYLNTGFSEVRRQRNRKKSQYFDTNDGLNNHTEQTCGDYKNHKSQYLSPNLDQDFIADIIKRQYRPVKLFGRKESDFSQFSAPVCRDQEFTFRETIQEGSDLCSCCHQEHRRHSSNDLSDMKSMCDKRLYSSKKHKHIITNYRHNTNEVYNDSAIYDVIPVKEKCSPKSRRKFVEDNMLMHDNYREVPPSPRTQRPQFNLQAQIQTEDDEDDIILEKQLRRMKILQQKSLIQKEKNVNNMSTDFFIHSKKTQCLQHEDNPKSYTEECVGTTSNIPYPTLTHEQEVVNVEGPLNTLTTDASAEKTDNALIEIKDILQCFLHEIKKESPQSEKFNNSPRLDEGTNTNEIQQQSKSNSVNNNNNFGQCSLTPFIQSFPNSCCYPLLPVCPINCMQNGFVLPSSSFTLASCGNNSKEQACGSSGTNKTNSLKGATSETQKLIKEIHNLISQNPNSIQKNEICQDAEIKALKTKSTCCTSQISKHDANVGTPQFKCHSKSCEAIGPREATDSQYTTNVSYSDTILEKESVDIITTMSSSESAYSTGPINKKENKFKSILRSLGIFKRNSSQVIEELNERGCSTVDLERLKARPPSPSYPMAPYLQELVNYNMHGQNYFHRSLTPQHQHQYQCCAHHDPRPSFSPTNKKIKNSQGRYHQEQELLVPDPTPTFGNYYDPHYASVSPQVPVCLQEIEVKSIGTQSVRKISLLKKFTNKMQVSDQQAKESSPKQSSALTSSKDKNSKDKPERSLFDWKKVHEKAMQDTTIPLKFSYKPQSKFEGDNTMRNVMIKKLFYKRNPFSTRNLLVRSLLGKGKSGFDAQPKMFKPKMFF